MSLGDDRKQQLDKLIDYRNDIIDILANIQTILKNYFPDEFDIAYQHYIPQIVTALYDEKKWLSRGSYGMQDTINNLTDKLNNQKTDQSIKRYI